MGEIPADSETTAEGSNAYVNMTISLTDPLTA